MLRTEEKILIKRSHPDAIIPTVKTSGSAGADLYTCKTVNARENIITEIDTGILVELPDDYCWKIYLRSGFASQYGAYLVTSGLIDNDYRGRIIIHVKASKAFKLRKGERFAQAVLVKVPYQVFEETFGLSETERGTNGFGSTGKY